MTADAKGYASVRGTTLELAAPLSDEDCTVQSMPDASPVKWHLAHTTWFFETFVLEPGVAGYRPFHPDFRVLFNSYYNSVGEQHPRARRGMLSRPSLAEVLAYRRAVDETLVRLLEAGVDARQAAVVELGLHHEQQHQELILTDLKHMLAQNPLRPVYREAPAPPGGHPKPTSWVGFDGGPWEVGHPGDGFAFDNEGPRHTVQLQPFALADRLVTAGEYLEFMGDGGYTRPELWLSEGWSAIQEHGWRAPLYWSETGPGSGAWEIQTLAGPRAVTPSEPLCHVSYYEADAFASWTGDRLPTEFEWERAGEAADSPGAFLEDGAFHPRALHHAGAGVHQHFGDVWEWTRSAYLPYPGYRPPTGALGEYNGKFMVNQQVLRGGSCATPRSHIRGSYRNFFPAGARWQFSGVRLARDAG
ncbi:MAG: ergothioneine biosynthesis protein EgtB [Myxococcota bacterium]